MSSYEKPDIKYYPFNFKKDKTIHLGIQTNIVAVDDRVKLGLHTSAIFGKIQDFTATLYLGKIIFKRNKQNNIAPIFIPSTITETNIEKLNTFWLNKINLNAKKPNANQLYLSSMLACEKKRGVTQCLVFADENLIPYQKIHYFRHKDNIVLTKEQIISYFTQLHQENTEFIANYIESINKNNGINAYHLHNSLFENLTQKGVLPESMIRRYIDTREIIRNNMLDLITLDFLARINQPNHKILLYDELFYAYLVWSLREFLIPYFSGRFQDENHLLFNAGAYKEHFDKTLTHNQDETDYDYLMMKNPYTKTSPNTEFIPIFYPNISPLEFEFGYIEGFVRLNIMQWSYSYEEEEKMMKKSKGYKQISLNQPISQIQKYEIYDMSESQIEQASKITPSPLGKYYFELSDNKGVYIEFFPRIYPSITNPPKGWSKEMMQKLDLKLE
ncbi:hypothetical protein [Helicobacter sp. T3_23-1059]